MKNNTDEACRGITCGSGRCEQGVCLCDDGFQTQGWLKPSSSTPCTVNTETIRILAKVQFWVSLSASIFFSVLLLAQILISRHVKPKYKHINRQRRIFQFRSCFLVGSIAQSMYAQGVISEPLVNLAGVSTTPTFLEILAIYFYWIGLGVAAQHSIVSFINSFTSNVKLTKKMKRTQSTLRDTQVLDYFGKRLKVFLILFMFNTLLNFGPLIWPSLAKAFLVTSLVTIELLVLGYTIKIGLPLVQHYITSIEDSISSAMIEEPDRRIANLYKKLKFMKSEITRQTIVNNICGFSFATIPYLQDRAIYFMLVAWTGTTAVSVAVNLLYMPDFKSLCNQKQRNKIGDSKISSYRVNSQGRTTQLGSSTQPSSTRP